MNSAAKIASLRGLRDVFSAELSRQRDIQTRLERHFALYGYAPVASPILEPTELFLRKSGEDAAARLYEFDFKNRRIAMRPELSASILRAYVEHLQDAPLPLRLQYCGPVFRYEKPQQLRSRQFTLCGVELIGAAGPLADAEILHLACSGLEQLGIQDYSITIGHRGMLADFLQGLGLRQQLRTFLLRNMENLRKYGLATVLEKLPAIYPAFAAELAQSQVQGSATPDKSQGLLEALRAMSEEEAHQAVTDFLASLNIRIASHRDQRDVVDRLLRKLHEDAQAPKLMRALDYMQRLSQLCGAPADTLPAARDLAREFGSDARAIDDLERSLARFADYGAFTGSLQLDCGLQRGLHHSTGLNFELHVAGASGEPVQLCGGGRYDHFIQALGANEPKPALGFAFGLERLSSLFDTGDAPPAPATAALVIPIAACDRPEAASTARDLRADGIATELCIDERSLRRSLKAAARRRIPLALLIGEREREAQSLVLRDLREGSELRIPRANICQAVKERLRAQS